jgi:DNA mismatch repair ATPase MutL
MAQQGIEYIAVAPQVSCDSSRKAKRNNNGNRDRDHDRHPDDELFRSVEVHTVPAALQTSDVGIVTKFIREQVAVLSSTRGAATASSVIPRVIMDVIASRACHGAIKFGDALNKDQCTELINSLSKCQAPFQCAHGRPTTLPIAVFEA